MTTQMEELKEITDLVEQLCAMIKAYRKKYCEPHLTDEVIQNMVCHRIQELIATGD